MALTAQITELDMKKRAEKHIVMDGHLKSGEVKTGKNSKHLKNMYLNTSEPVKRSSGEMGGIMEEIKTKEMRVGEKKAEKKKKGKEKRTDGGKEKEKKARKGSEDVKEQGVKDSRVMKKIPGQGDTEKTERFWSVSCSSTVDLIGGEKNTKQATHRRARDEMDKCAVTQIVSIQGATDSNKIREERDQKDESSDADPYVVWVQCSKPECGKWRRLNGGVDPSALPDDWICQNNTDVTFRSCSAPEEKSSVPEEEMFFCSLVPGSLVWARQSGYPWWPAMVEQDPNTAEYLEFLQESDFTPYKCHVTYFGEPVTRAWITCKRVKDYAELSEDHFINKVDKGLKESILMAKEALKLSLKERLVRFGFSSRYVSDSESSEDSDIADMLERFCGKTGNDCSDEEAWSKKQSIGKKTSRMKGGNKSRWGKEDEPYGEGERKKGARKKLKKGKEAAMNSVPVKKRNGKKCLSPALSLPKKKKHVIDTTDQTVPQVTMETGTDMNFDLDVHSEGEEMERQRGRVREGIENEDEDGEYKDSPIREEQGCEEERDKLILIQPVEE